MYVICHGERASFESVLLTLFGPMLTHDRADGGVEALARRLGDAALLYPAEHVVFGVARSAAALSGVEVGISPRHKLKVDGIEHTVGRECLIKHATDKFLAFGS